MMVKCCRTYEEVYEGDVGKVIKLDRDGLHDLNVQCDWQQKGGTYWVRYIHTELLGTDFYISTKTSELNWPEYANKVFFLGGGFLLLLFSFNLPVSGFPPQSSPSHIKIGDKVRVKQSVTTPKYKWGSVTHRSVGAVKGKAQGHTQLADITPKPVSIHKPLAHHNKRILD